VSVRRWKRGSTSPAISDVLEDASGAQLNLSGATVTFWMGPMSGTATMRGTAAVSGGTVTYAWGTADLAETGLYGAYWRVAYSGGAIEKLPQGGAIPGAPDVLLVRVTDDRT
jgi:hypothetical protein